MCFYRYNRTMTSYLQTLLMRDEHIVHAARLHWVIYINAIIFTCIGWALAHFNPVNLLWQYARFQLPEQWMEQGLHYLVMLIVILGVGMIFEAYLRQSRTELVITNRRVMVKFGLVSRHTVELFLSKVEGANIEQGVLGRLLGYGSIHVKGTGTGMTPIDNIANPEIFQRVLLEQIRQRQDYDDHQRDRPEHQYAKHD